MLFLPKSSCAHINNCFWAYCERRRVISLRRRLYDRDDCRKCSSRIAPPVLMQIIVNRKAKTEISAHLLIMPIYDWLCRETCLLITMSLTYVSSQWGSSWVSSIMWTRPIFCPGGARASCVHTKSLTVGNRYTVCTHSLLVLAVTASCPPAGSGFGVAVHMWLPAKLSEKPCQIRPRCQNETVHGSSNVHSMAAALKMLPSNVQLLIFKQFLPSRHSGPEASSAVLDIDAGTPNLPRQPIKPAENVSEKRATGWAPLWRPPRRALSVSLDARHKVKQNDMPRTCNIHTESAEHIACEKCA